jgi:hypothetical protein
MMALKGFGARRLVWPNLTYYTIRGGTGKIIRKGLTL